MSMAPVSLLSIDPDVVAALCAQLDEAVTEVNATQPFGTNAAVFGGSPSSQECEAMATAAADRVRLAIAEAAQTISGHRDAIASMASRINEVDAVAQDELLRRLARTDLA